MRHRQQNGHIVEGLTQPPRSKIKLKLPRRQRQGAKLWCVEVWIWLLLDWNSIIYIVPRLTWLLFIGCKQEHQHNFMSEASNIFSNWDRLKIFCQDPVWFVSHWWGTPWRDSRHLGLCLHCVIYSVYHLYPIVSILKMVCPVAASIPASAIQWLSSFAKCRLEYR